MYPSLDELGPDKPESGADPFGLGQDLWFASLIWMMTARRRVVNAPALNRGKYSIRPVPELLHSAAAHAR
jgi:hypothetical protein